MFLFEKLISFQIESPIPYDIGITTCLISPYFSENIVDYEITISGWRYADHFTESKILGNNIISTVNRRECHSQKPQQQIYQRNSYAIPNPDGGYKDYKSLMNKVSFVHFILFTCIQANLITCKNTF